MENILSLPEKRHNMSYLVSAFDPALRRVSSPFVFGEDYSAQEFEKLLVAEMLETGGIGLAAPQIGVNCRAFAVAAEEPYVMFNPRIIDMSIERVKLDEGCLSVPGVMLEIERPKSIHVQYYDSSGKFTGQKLTGISSRVVQHEIDHLNGVLFIDRISKMKYIKAKDKARKKGFVGPFPKQQEIIYE